MKIAQICTNAMSGSVGKIARDLSLSLIARGHESVVCYSRGKDYNNHAFKFGNKLEIYNHALLARLFDSDGLYSKKATGDLIEFLKQYKPDIVHLHCLHGYYLNYPMLFKYLKNKLTVWTMHDCWAYTGHCAFYDFEGCNKWVEGCNNCPQKGAYPKSIVLDGSKRNYEIKKKIFNTIPKKNIKIVTPSAWLKNEL